VRARPAAAVCGLRRQWRAGDFGPDLERLGAGLPVVGDGTVVAAEMEQVGGTNGAAYRLLTRRLLTTLTALQDGAPGATPLFSVK